MFEELANQLSATLSPEAIAQAIAAWTPRVLASLATLAIFWLLWRLISRALAAVGRRADVDRTAFTFIQTTARYVYWAVGIVTALNHLGVDTSSVLASLGIVGITIGFAARDSVSNIISGMFIFWDRPFVIGDLVEIDGRYGRVEGITMRSTRVVTVDGKTLAIPNNTVATGTVISYTNFPNLRLDIQVTIGVDQSISAAREVMLDVARGREQTLESPPPEVIVTALNDYNIELQLRVWIQDERAHIAERAALRESVFDALTAANVDMPYETLRVVGVPA